MIIGGVALLLVGVLWNIEVLSVVGLVLLVVGLALWFVPLGGRTRRYW